LSEVRKGVGNGFSSIFGVLCGCFCFRRLLRSAVKHLISALLCWYWVSIWLLFSSEVVSVISYLRKRYSKVFVRESLLLKWNWWCFYSSLLSSFVLFPDRQWFGQGWIGMDVAKCSLWQLCLGTSMCCCLHVQLFFSSFDFCIQRCVLKLLEIT